METLTAKSAGMCHPLPLTVLILGRLLLFTRESGENSSPQLPPLPWESPCPWLLSHLISSLELHVPSPLSTKAGLSLSCLRVAPRAALTTASHPAASCFPLCLDLLRNCISQPSGQREEGASCSVVGLNSSCQGQGCWGSGCWGSPGRSMLPLPHALEGES